MTTRRTGIRRRLAKAVLVAEPEDPDIVVYGTLAIGLVLAAEDPASETYPRVLLASGVTLVLYWLAHGFATSLGERYAYRRAPSRKHFLASLKRELPIGEGALPAFLVILGGWVLGSSLETTVTAALWITVAVLAGFEAVAGIRAKLPRRKLVGSAAFGALLGAALLVVKALLH